jgi:hypothetical protein
MTNLHKMFRALVFGLTAASASAWAGDHVYNLGNAKYRGECGSCHVAYPPALLPAQSWDKLMTTLDKHFGSDASVDAKTAKDIGDFLKANAGVKKKVVAEGGTLRISETSWFKREHGEELSPAVWKNPKVKSPANCEACHLQAAEGDYSERSIRVPR